MHSFKMKKKHIYNKEKSKDFKQQSDLIERWHGNFNWCYDVYTFAMKKIKDNKGENN